MDDSPSENIKWSAQEWKMINSVEVFLQKPNIMKKAESYLHAFRDALADELTGTEAAFPPGTDLKKGQLVRGENLKGFPFLSMDLPQMFSKTEMFTYRAVFWWGHYLGYSLILKGEHLNHYLDRLREIRGNPSWSEIYLATGPTPWEWERRRGNFILVAKIPEDELKKRIATIQHIKLCRFYPVQEDSFSSLDWVSAGIDNWRILSSITAP